MRACGSASSPRWSGCPPGPCATTTTWVFSPSPCADVYGVLYVLMIIAACVTRPHVVTAEELRVRYGMYFDLRVPRHLISSVRLSRDYNESGMITVADLRLSVVVSSQTNVVVEPAEPVTVVRPLGGRAEATTIRFFTDTPEALLNALRPSPHHSAP